MTPDEARDGLLSIVEALDSVGGRFRDIRRIGLLGGGGHFSLMFTAHDEVSGQRVALKVFNPVHRGNAYRLDSFEREIQLLETLAGQADIVRIVSPGATFTEILRSETGIPVPVDFSYYAMELADRSAKDRLIDGRWTATERLIAFRAMCRATQRLHAADMSHRDIKPDNMLQIAGGAWVLSDFGTARHFGDGVPALLPSYGVFIPGDKRYWAPEMMAGLHDGDARISKRSDVFALGAVLFELFSGTPLGTQIYDIAFVEDLMRFMAPTPLSKRTEIYHAVIPQIVDARPLPALAAYSTDLPRCIGPYIDELYRSMAALDYRARPLSFAPVFRKLDICVRILNNEAAYHRYRALRDRRRAARLA